jgi:hypothetical protein
MHDPITGLEIEIVLDKQMFIVTDDTEAHAFSIHFTKAEARAKIRWYWERKYPQTFFMVIPV